MTTRSSRLRSTEADAVGMGVGGNIAEMVENQPRVTQRVVRPGPSVDAVRQIVVAAEERDPRLATAGGWIRRR